MSRLRRYVLALVMVVAVVLGVPVAAQAAEGDVAQIGDKTYATLMDAIQNSEDGDTITLLADAKLPSTSFSAGKEIVIDGVDFEIDAASAYLNIAGDVTFKNCKISFTGTPNGHWMYIYMASNGHLTFDSAVVTIDGSDSTNNMTTAMYFPEPSTPAAEVDIINTELTAKNCAGNGISWGGATSGGRNQLRITNGSKVILENNASKNTTGGGGIIGTFDVTVTDSTLKVFGNKGYGSNGSNYTISNSTVEYSNNGTHGLSATDLIIEKNSIVTADGNGYYGVRANGKFKVDGTSKLIVTHNSDAEDGAGLKLASGVTDGSVEPGAIVTISDNYCSGLSNNGKVVFEEGAKLTITGNMNDKGSSSYGGGVYNSGSGADLTLPTDAVIYNNHAKTAGDDIYNGNLSTITFGPVGSNWKLDGVGIDNAEDDCTDAIDGWYDDSKGSRWEAHSVPFHAVEHASGKFPGTRALKAAHGLVSIEPDDPNLPEWAASKSKTATELDEDNISDVTLSLPAEDYKQTMDVVFVIDDTHAGSGIFEQSVSDLLDELASKKNLDINVGIIAFDAVSRDWLDVTSNGVYSGLVSISDENALNAIKTAVRTRLDYNGAGERKKIGGTNTEWPVVMATEMLNNGEGEDKYLIMFSDMYGYVYRGTLELDGTTYTNVPMSKRNNGLDQGQLTISNVKWPNWDYVYKNFATDDRPEYDGFFRKSSWKNYWEIYQSVTVETEDQPNAPETPYGESYFTPFEKSLCLTYDNIVAAEQSGVNVVLVNNDFDPGSNGGTGDIRTVKNGMLDSLISNGLMVIRESAGNGEKFTSDQMSKIFSTLENELIQLVDKGSYVVDEMGSSTYAGVAYDFDFVSKIDNLKLTVNGEALNVTEIDKGDATAAYQFGNDEDPDQFVLKYYENGTTLNDISYGECFVWVINVPVKKDAPVQLTYSVQLDYPQTTPGTYGTYDRDGSKELDGLYTNNSATLFPVDSKGEMSSPQSFYKPTVSYEVEAVTVWPADMTIYMGGDDGYDSVVTDDEGNTVIGSDYDNSLPEPGFYIQLDDELNKLINDANPGAVAATDLSEMITFRQANDPNGRTWKFEKYGTEDGSSEAYDKFVYKLIPTGENQDSVRLEFTDGDGNHFVSDTFNPGATGINHLSNKYKMGIYAGGADLSSIVMEIKIGNKTYTRAVKVDTGTLTVRYVVDNEDNPVTSVVDNFDPTENKNVGAVAEIESGASYYVNESDIVKADNVKASLLFDNIVTGETGNEDTTAFDDALLAKAESVAKLESDGHEAKYLNLVDANNGNAWLTTDKAVTVYWPYPKGTDKDTDFSLVHFVGLDRGDVDNEDIVSTIEKIPAAEGAAENSDMVARNIKVEKTDHGVMFTLDPEEYKVEVADGETIEVNRVRFSPFVLMWTAASEPGTDPEPTPTTGSLKVTKAITGDLADEGDEFTFTVTLSGTSAAEGNKTYGGVKFTDGVATITLRGGESKTLTGIPSGTRYAIEETDANGYELASSSGTTGTIYAGGTRTASFTNDKSAAETPEPATARLVARKVLNGAELKAGQFTFELRDADGRVVATATNDASGTIVFDGLTFDEAGTYEFTISEVDGGSEDYTYDASVKGCYVVVTEEGGKLVAEAFAHDDLVFTNEYVGTEDPSEPDTPDTPDTPDEPGEPTTPVTPGEDVPDTGDHTDGILPAALALGGVALVGGALVVARRRAM